MTMTYYPGMLSDKYLLQQLNVRRHTQSATERVGGRRFTVVPVSSASERLWYPCVMASCIDKNAGTFKCLFPKAIWYANLWDTDV